MRDVLLSDPDGLPRPPTVAVLGTLGAILTSGLVAGLYRLLRRRAGVGWLLALVTAVVYLGFGAGIVLIAIGWLDGAPDALLFGVPRSLGWLLWLPALGAIGTGGLVVAVLAAWLRKMGSLMPRLHLTGVAVAASLLSWVLLTYGVIGQG